MVLKSSKYGVYSGNTLRASTSKYLRQYKKHSCLIRRVIKGPQYADKSIRQSEVVPVLGELDVNSDDVTFSLNKKGRWTLPAMLRDTIVYSGSLDEEEYGVQLIEYQKLKRTANCVGFYSTDGPVRAATTRETLTRRKTRRGNGKRGYMCASSFLCKKQKTSGVEEGTGNTPSAVDTEEVHVARETTAAEDGPSQLRYEVFYPSPMTSSITHNPKYLLKSNDDFDSDLYKFPRHLNHRNTRRRRKIENDIWDELSALDDDFDDLEEELDVTDDVIPNQCRSDIVLADIMQAASRAEQLLSVKPDKRKHSTSKEDSYDNGRRTKLVVLENKAEKDEPQESKHEVSKISSPQERDESRSVQCEPVRIILSSEQVSPNTLENRYGGSYIECDCFPRKFIIDISDRVYNVSKVGIITCLVFVLDVENEMNTLTDDVYKVTMNVECHQINNMKIETIFDYMECTMENVIDRATFFLETLPQNVMETRPIYHTKTLTLGTVDEYLTWRSHSYKPDAKYLFDSLMKRNEQIHEANDLGFQVVSKFDESLYDRHDQVSSPKDRFCDVCFNEIGGDVSATSLMSCGHWFCDECWKDHLEVRIRDGKKTLTCPEYQCDEIVDPGTLMSLVCMRRIIKFVKRCHDTEVEQQMITKWCPDPKCGCVLKIDNVKQKNVKCRCGRQLCFDCLGDAHWPAPCAAQTDYIRKLKKSGDEYILPIEAVPQISVRGKPCLHCHLFVEKYGGCPYMHCVCGGRFCLGCGKDYYKNIHDRYCSRGQDDTYSTTEHNIKADKTVTNTKRGSRWYSNALHHRVQQHPEKVRSMKRAIPSMTKDLQAYMGKARRRGEEVKIEFEVSNKNFQVETEKVPYLLKRMVELYLELHKLTENASVLLDNADQRQRPVSAIAHGITRLDVFCMHMYELYVNRFDAKTVITRLHELRKHSRMGVKCLVRHVEMMKVDTDS